MSSMSNTVEELIIKYVERQQKIVEIVRLLRPDLFLRATGDKSIDELYSCFDTKVNEIGLPNCGIIYYQYINFKILVSWKWMQASQHENRRTFGVG